jgi:lysophospholipase III
MFAGKPSTVHYFCLKQTAQYFDLWLNLELFSPLIIDCWADNMRLEFNETTGRAEDLDGVHIRVPGFGNTHAIEWSENLYLTIQI